MNATNEPTLQELLDVAKRLFGQKINWRFMREASAIPLSDLAAMSVGLTAAFVESVIEETTPSPETPIDELVEMLAYRDANVEEARHRKAIAFIRLSARDGLHPAIGEIDGFNTPVFVSEFAAFAQSMGWELPPEFPRPLAAPVSIQPAATPGAAESNEPKAAEAVPGGWIEQVRAIALEYIAKHKAKDLFPSQSDVCGYIERMAREKKIYGPQGRPVSQSYIQRNAIQGDWWKQNKP